MIYLLDTNIVSYWMRGDERIIDRLKQQSPSDLSLSTITLAEIYYGIEKSPIKKKQRHAKIQRICSLLAIHVFDEPAACEYGRIRYQLERRGTVISERDMQIAAIALANKANLVTHNVREFSRIQALKVEDWAVA